MLIGYAGKIINGKPALTEEAALPENADIIIMILPQRDTKKAIQIDDKEIENRLAMVESLTGILAGQNIDLDKIKEERLKKRELLE